MPPPSNLFADLPNASAAETLETLLQTEHVRIERIVSSGQASPDGYWFDQPGDEWVLVVQGRARLNFADGAPKELGPGDFVYIPAHQRHRVEWSDPQQATIWLAVHIEAASA
jgi:cupin 2 domain-containing protein